MDLEVGRRVNEALDRVTRGSALWIAIRFLMRSLQEAQWEMRYMTLWIVMEALFGPDDPGETTVQLAQRASLLVEPNDERRWAFYQSVKKAYNIRSRIVHGRNINRLTPQRSAELMAELEGANRTALNTILLDSALLATFSSKKRDEHLAKLVVGVNDRLAP